MSLTRARTIQYIGLLFILGALAAGYWYFSVRAGVKSNTSATQPQGSGRLDSGLAGYWRLDENTGTSAGDASTNGNSGTLTNGPTWTTGQIKTGVDFDGTDDYITVADPASGVLDFNLIGTGSGDRRVTLTGWFNRDTFANDHTIIAKKNDQSTGIGYVVWIDGTDDKLHVQLYGDNASGSTVASSRTFTTTGWHHFAVYIGDFDNGGDNVPLIYIDGVSDFDPSSGSGYVHYVWDMSNALPFRIGAESDGGNPFDGKLDEVRVYDRMLSADEVADLYRLTAPTGVDTGLKGYWSFDGSDTLKSSSDPQFTDLSGAGGTGSIVSFASSETKLVPGKLGQAVDFENDGSVDNYIFAGPADSLDNATYVSACAWINPESTPGGWAAIMGKGWEFEVTSSNAIQVWLPSIGTHGGAWDTPNGSIPFGTWSHVCFTRDFSSTANAPIIYINGSAVSTVFTDDIYVGMRDNSADDLVIGAWDSGSVADYFDGVIDEARVYNRLLSAGEVKSLYDGSASDKTNTSATQPTSGLSSGLAGYWKLDENTGTSAGDASTNGNSGTLTNGPTWTTGQIKTGVDFDGIDDYITVADPASGVLDAVGDQYYTLSGWFNRDTATTTDTILAKSNGPADTMGYLVYLDATTDKLVFSTRSTLGDNSYQSISTFTAAGWHHFAVVFNIPRTGGNFGQIYIDGSIQNDNNGAGGYGGSIDSTRAFVIGAESDAGNPFDGKLDEIRLYNRALSADEVGQLYRLTTPTGVDTSLKGYWSFNGADISGTTASDRSGAGNNGTLTNSPTKVIGKLGQALNFDGVDDYVTVADPGTASALDFGSASTITLSAWVKPSTFDGTEGAIISKEVNNSSASPNYYIGSDVCSGSTCQLIFAYDTGSCDFSAPQAFTSSAAVLTANVWQYVSVTYSFGTGSSIKIYVNGIEQVGTWIIGNGNIAPCQGNMRLIIGQNYDGQTFNGTIDEVRIYNRALSANEVKSLYDLGASDKVNTSVATPQGTGRLDSGLAGYWKLDENTGTSAGDASVNGNSGTLTNGPTWTTGRIGSAVTFDGTDDYISVPQSAAINDLPKLSVSAWIRTNGEPGSWRIVQKNNDPCCLSEPNQGWRFVIADNGSALDKALQFDQDYSGAGNYLRQRTVNNVIVPNTWQHVVATWDGSLSSANVHIYVDGVEKTTGADQDATGSRVSDAAQNLAIGAAIPAPVTDVFNGSIDEVRIYNRVLSADEVAQLYRLTSPTGTDTSLKGYWSFNGPDLSGTTASDRSGAGNNGTLTNGPTKSIGKLGQALNFNASDIDDLVSVPSSATLDNVTDKTVSAWIYPRSTGASGNIISKSQSGYYLWGSGITTNNALHFYHYFNVSAGQWLTPNDSVTLNNWNHIAFVFTRSSASVPVIYINGVPQTLTVASSPSGAPFDETSRPIEIGNTTFTSANPFDGKIDEVRVYNRALSAAEIKTLYTSGK
jgi:hypothetical protein